MLLSGRSGMLALRSHAQHPGTALVPMHASRSRNRSQYNQISIELHTSSVDGAFVGRSRARTVAAAGRGGEQRQSSINGVIWSVEEKALLQEALAAVQLKAQEAGASTITYKAVFEKFVELSGGQTSRQYPGTKMQIKNMEEQVAAASQTISTGSATPPVGGATGHNKAPAVTVPQMAGEVMSTLPGMQATKEEVAGLLAKHPIYCHLLNWTPTSELDRSSFIKYAWQSTFVRALNRKQSFTRAAILSSAITQAYVFNPSAPNQFNNLWRGMPWVLASLLATYLAQPVESGAQPESAACTAAELTDALLKHPMYGEVLKQLDGGRTARLNLGRFLPRVERALEENIGTLFERAQVVKGKPRVYKAIIRPRTVA